MIHSSGTMMLIITAALNKSRAAQIWDQSLLNVCEEHLSPSMEGRMEINSGPPACIGHAPFFIAPPTYCLRTLSHPLLFSHSFMLSGRALE